MRLLSGSLASNPTSSICTQNFESAPHRVWLAYSQIWAKTIKESGFKAQ
jgi:hypothetical protein